MAFPWELNIDPSNRDEKPWGESTADKFPADSENGVAPPPHVSSHPND
jgi:hypothetical protein